VEVQAKHTPYEHRSVLAVMSGKKAARDYAQAVSDAAAKVWKDMSSLQGDFPATHDVYLKLWALRGDYSGFDMVLFDEAQDANPVMISALQKMQDNGAQIILVGDPHQSIYGWRGAVDAMSAFPDFKQAYLTESFRFGQNIADAAQLFLTAAGETRQLKGRNPNPGVHRDGPTDSREPFPANAILCRSNAGVIFTSLNYIESGKKPYVEGGAQEAAKLLTALRDLYHTKGGRDAKFRPRHPEIALFETWEDLEQYSESREGGSFKPFVGITKRMMAQGTMDASIHALTHGTAESRQDADVTVSTVHKAKGLEWHNVHMGADWEKVPLHVEHTYLDDDGDEQKAYAVNQENYKLLYVAWTRAQSGLDTSGWHGVYEQQAQAIRDIPVTPDIAARIAEYEKGAALPQESAEHQRSGDDISSTLAMGD
jgi:superfamily I DNA/RNA helicase